MTARSLQLSGTESARSPIRNDNAVERLAQRGIDAPSTEINGKAQTDLCMDRRDCHGRNLWPLVPMEKRMLLTGSIGDAPERKARPACYGDDRGGAISNANCAASDAVTRTMRTVASIVNVDGGGPTYTNYRFTNEPLSRWSRLADFCGRCYARVAYSPVKPVRASAHQS